MGIYCCWICCWTLYIPNSNRLEIEKIRTLCWWYTYYWFNIKK